MTSKAIAIDTMGGDYGPSVTVPAALRVLQRHPNLKLILVGDQKKIKRRLKAYKVNSDRQDIEVQHASQVVAMDESPSQALRYKKDSSMRVAIDLVKRGEAQACVSAGNTGALMGIARLVLRTLPGIERPAIMSSFPTYQANKEVSMIDLGANVDSHAEHLVQFAVMGSIVASSVKGIQQPRVGLLNVGKEENKGNEQVKQTSQLLSETEAVNYTGFIEGDSLFTGDVDIVVCDGFVGNVTLKAVEGMAKLTGNFIKESFQRNWFTKLLGVLSWPVLRRIKTRMDPGQRNGANLLGLQGVVLKSHGGADIEAYASAVEKAVVEAEVNLPQRISDEVADLLASTET